MTEAQAIEAISQLVVTGWASASGGLPLALENEALPGVDSFAALTVRHAVAQQITHGKIGGRRMLYTGFIFVKLWGPADAGRKSLSTLADAVRAFLGSVDIVVAGEPEPITTQEAVTQEAGIDGRWFMLVVQAPFRYYALR